MPYRNLWDRRFRLSIPEAGVGRPVINKTGLTGRFDYHLEFTPDQTTPGFQAGDSNGAPTPVASDPAGTSISPPCVNNSY